MKNKRSSTAKMQIACAIIFITFTYVYLAFYQADVLAVAQHVFSGGLTNYSYTLAPLLITLVLYLLQVGVYVVTRVKRRFHGLIQIKWLIRFQMHCLTSFWLTMTTLIAPSKPFVLLVR